MLSARAATGEEIRMFARTLESPLSGPAKLEDKLSTLSSAPGFAKNMLSNTHEYDVGLIDKVLVMTKS